MTGLLQSPAFSLLQLQKPICTYDPQLVIEITVMGSERQFLRLPTPSADPLTATSTVRLA